MRKAVSHTAKEHGLNLSAGASPPIANENVGEEGDDACMQLPAGKKVLGHRREKAGRQVPSLHLDQHSLLLPLTLFSIF